MRSFRLRNGRGTIYHRNRREEHPQKALEAKVKGSCTSVHFTRESVKWIKVRIPNHIRIEVIEYTDFTSLCTGSGSLSNFEKWI